MATGDIIQDQQDGWFYRDNGDGTADNLSRPPAKVGTATIARPIVLVRDGAATGHGDALAVRVAVAMARRYVAMARRYPEE